MVTIKVQGFESLIRDTKSNGIVNTNVSEYNVYMARIKNRNKQSDSLRSAVKEINSLKSELREIKDLLKKVTQ